MQMQTSPRVYLFPPVLEKIYFAILAVLLVLFVVFGAQFSVDMHMYRVLELFTLFLFLNNIHTYFTLMLLMFVPEFRTLLVEKLKNRKWAVKFGVIVSLIVAGAVYWSFHLHLSSGVDKFFLLFMGMWKTVHGTAQTKGISLLYNKAQTRFLNPEQVTQLKKIERIERFLFIPFIWGLVAQFLCSFLPLSTGPLLAILIAVTLAASVLINLNALRYPRVPRTNKSVFLINAIVYACGPISMLSYFYTSCLHGLEYTFLCGAMLKRSAFKMTHFVGAAASVLFVVLLFANFYYRAHKTLAFTLLPTQLIPPLAILSIFAEYLHFYLDSEIYRMHDPVVRRNLSPVLTLGET